MQLFSVLLFTSLSSFGVAAPTGIDEKFCGSKSSTLGPNQDSGLVRDPDPEAADLAFPGEDECFDKSEAFFLSCEKSGKPKDECQEEEEKQLQDCLKELQPKLVNSLQPDDPEQLKSPESPKLEDEPADLAFPGEDECFDKSEAFLLSCEKSGKPKDECQEEEEKQLQDCLKELQPKLVNSLQPDDPEQLKSPESPKLEDEPNTDGLGLLDPKLRVREPAGQSRGLKANY